MTDRKPETPLGGVATAELDALVQRLEKHQEALGLTDAQFAARYQRHLSSTDTWQRSLRARNWGRLGNRSDRWLTRLRAAVAEIDGGTPVEDYFTSLPLPTYAEALFQRLAGADNDRRCAVLVGGTGVGKSATLRWLQRQHPRETAYVRANETWRDRRAQIASGIARAVGAAELPGSAGRTWLNVIERLKGEPMTLLIDEAHEGGVVLLKMLKTLIDETRCRVILATLPPAWRRLILASSEAHEEAQQLLGRTVKPIAMQWANGPRAEDVCAYLEAATDLNGQSKALAQKLAPTVRRLGLRLLSDAVAASKAVAESRGEEVTPTLLLEVTAELADCGLGRGEG